MASYKRVVLTECDTTTENTVDNYQQNDVQTQMNKFDNTYTSKKLNELYNQYKGIELLNIELIDKVYGVNKLYKRGDIQCLVQLNVN